MSRHGCSCAPFPSGGRARRWQIREPASRCLLRPLSPGLALSFGAVVALPLFMSSSCLLPREAALGPFAPFHSSRQVLPPVQSEAADPRFGEPVESYPRPFVRQEPAAPRAVRVDCWGLTGAYGTVQTLYLGQSEAPLPRRLSSRVPESNLQSMIDGRAGTNAWPPCLRAGPPLSCNSRSRLP